MLLDLLTVAVLAVVGTRLVSFAVMTARSRTLRDRTLAILRQLRPRHFLRAPFVLVVVLLVATALIQVPGLSWGWWTAIGGTGNVIVGGSDRTGLGTLTRYTPVLFVALLIPLLPLFAEREEEAFRMGAEGWSRPRRVRRSVEFGLVHLIMGIPIGVALALSLGGGYFTWAYLRGYRAGGRRAAVIESTCSHLAYNLEIMALVFVVLVLGL
jgi:preprotein translocase subunit SecG